MPMMTRRDCLKVGGAAAALAASGCAPLARGGSQPALPEPWLTGEGDGPLDPAIWRTMNRASFGPRPGELARVRESGLEACVGEQLHAQPRGESPAVVWRVGSLDTLQV